MCNRQCKRSHKSQVKNVLESSLWPPYLRDLDRATFSRFEMHNQTSEYWANWKLFSKVKTAIPDISLRNFPWNVVFYIAMCDTKVNYCGNFYPTICSLVELKYRGNLPWNCFITWTPGYHLVLKGIIFYCVEPGHFNI